MGRSLFSVPIFFIVFRETLEAAIIVSVLLGLVEQIARPRAPEAGIVVADWNPERWCRCYSRIFAGALLRLFIALAIGAAFIAVWFTQAANLWASTEALWEGIFSLVAALIIMPMGLTMLKLDRARAK
ncbi:hypothetical protein EW145_g6634 [Phellinidium pouzarii]|uniref:Uncharacterized protein n=1 Tax=Phellinidium pouzarii TaxID=167371 RepID=A0A4S4KXT8_9AGAM|nr:hypothetical protein EW145_g6634 [Phellinidium pouzarii]